MSAVIVGWEDQTPTPPTVINTGIEWQTDRDTWLADKHVLFL